VLNTIRFALVTALIVATAGLMASPVFAGEDGDSDGADFLMWRWNPGGPRGIGAIQDGTSNTIMFAEVLGLKPNSTYRIVASMAPCRDNHRRADRVLGIRVDTGNMVDSFINTTFDDGVVLATIKSVRLFMGSTQIDCGRTMPYNIATGPNPSDGLTLSTFMGEDGVFGMIMIDLGTGDDQISLALHGLTENADHRVVGSDQACPGPLAPRLFRYGFMSNARGSRYLSDIIEEIPIPSYLYLGEVGVGQVACTEALLLVPAIQA
jgi:hypothetical protein